MIYQDSQAVVTNNINVSTDTSGGDSSSYTKVTTTTNGKTTVVESSDQGSIKVETLNGETTVKTSPGMKVDIKEGEATTAPKATTSGKVATPKIKSNIWQRLKLVIENFMAKLNFSF